MLALSLCLCQAPFSPDISAVTPPLSLMLTSGPFSVNSAVIPPLALMLMLSRARLPWTSALLVSLLVLMLMSGPSSLNISAVIGFGELGGTPPPWIPRSTLPGYILQWSLEGELI